MKYRVGKPILFYIINILQLLQYVNVHLQALLRNWRRLGLIDAPRNILSMTMTMALIPSDYFEQALSLIQIEIDKTSYEYPALKDFLAYVRKIWLPLASNVSVYDCPARTNNITESFHNVAGRKFGKVHENVWSFLGNVVINIFSFTYIMRKSIINILLTDNLKKLIIDEEIKLKRLKTTETGGHRTSIKNKNRDNKILKMQTFFAAGR